MYLMVKIFMYPDESRLHGRKPMLLLEEVLKSPSGTLSEEELDNQPGKHCVFMHSVSFTRLMHVPSRDIPPSSLSSAFLSISPSWQASWAHYYYYYYYYYYHYNYYYDYYCYSHSYSSCYYLFAKTNFTPLEKIGCYNPCFWPNNPDMCNSPTVGRMGSLS